MSTHHINFAPPNGTAPATEAQSPFADPPQHAAPDSRTSTDSSNSKTQVSPSYQDALAQTQKYSGDAPSLNVDFVWKKWLARVLEPGSDDPLYTCHCKPFSIPSQIFKNAREDRVIGTSNLNTLSIHTYFDVGGRKSKLKAYRRFITDYTHNSGVWKKPDGSPQMMHWTTKWDLKHWDFICVDETNMPVARFSANNWAIKKMGRFDFMGPLANNVDAREEMIVSGLTLFFVMVQRASSILHFFSAFIARTGDLKPGELEKLQRKEAAYKAATLTKERDSSDSAEVPTSSSQPAGMTPGAYLDEKERLKQYNGTDPSAYNNGQFRSNELNSSAH